MRTTTLTAILLLLLALAWINRDVLAADRNLLDSTDSPCCERWSLEFGVSDSDAVKAAKRILAAGNYGERERAKTLQELGAEAETGKLDSQIAYGLLRLDGAAYTSPEALDALVVLEVAAARGHIDGQVWAATIRLHLMDKLSGTECQNYNLNRLEYWARSVIRLAPDFEPIHVEALSLLGQALMNEDIASSEGWLYLTDAVAKGSEGAKKYIVALDGVIKVLLEEGTDVPREVVEKVSDYIEARRW